MSLAKNMRPQDSRIGRLFERIQDAVIVADSKTQQIVFWNPAAEKVFGYSTSEALELRVEALVPEYLKARHRAGIARYNKTGHGSYIDSRELLELPALRKGGEEICIELSLSPIRAVEEETDGDDGRFVLAIVREVTERKRTEEALLQSEERHRRLVELSPEAIAVHSEGKFVYMNAAGARLLGATKAEELIGKAVLDFVHPDYVELVKTRVRRTQEEDKAVDLAEIKMVRLDGEIIDVETRGMPISYRGLPATQAVIRDMTERKRVEEARLRLVDIVNSSDDAIIGKTLEGVITSWNSGAQKLYGYSSEEVVGRSISILVPPDRSDEIPTMLEKVRRGERVDHYDTMRVKRDGDQIHVSVTVSPIRDSVGNIVGASAIARDITERKRAEEALQEANRHLSELATLRTDFTAIVAHEISSPLATIRMFLEVLATGELEPAEEADTLARIRTETDRLSTLVADVKSAAAIEREEFALMPRQTSTSELLEDATRFAETLPGNHPLIVEVSAEEPVWADAYRIGQVLRNLLSNAVKYSPEGAPIELRAIRAESPGRVRIEVADCGEGVHPDDVERIFKKFGRGRERSGRKTYGVGLGLYLSRRILQAHGSELELDSMPGDGAVFGFELEAVR